LQVWGRQELTPHEALESINWLSAGLLMTEPAARSWQVFSPAQRITHHAHHARKYADTWLPEDKAFRFVNAGNTVTVHNIGEFYRAIQTVPQASLRHHLTSNDFSRWVSEVLGDEQLAKGLRKLERATPVGATPDRAEILAHVADHYLIQED